MWHLGDGEVYVPSDPEPGDEPQEPALSHQVPDHPGQGAVQEEPPATY